MVLAPGFKGVSPLSVRVIFASINVLMNVPESVTGKQMTGSEVFLLILKSTL
jgi:hypothetical protein